MNKYHLFWHDCIDIRHTIHHEEFDTISGAEERMNDILSRRSTARIDNLIYGVIKEWEYKEVKVRKVVLK